MTAPGAAIAAAALKYQGQRYVFGGRADKPGDWDYSSFVSYVLGHDLGMVLPGGGMWNSPAYPPNAHGPVVLTYAGWAGASTLPSGMSPAAGDLCLWAGAGALGHIGFAVSATTMMSALDTAQGTLVTPIQGYGPKGVTVVYRRINGAAQTAAAGTQSAAGNIAAMLAVTLAAGTLPLVIAGVILAGATLLGLAAAGLIGAAMNGESY